MPAFTSGPAVKRRWIGVPILAAIVGLVATGCSSFIAAPTASQQNVIGPIAVTSDICLDGFAQNGPTPEAPTYGANCGNPPAGLATYTFTGTTPAVDVAASQGQLMIAYLVPDGASAPPSLTSADLDGVTFTPSSDYVAYLDTAEVPPTGDQWVGYLSSEFTVTQATAVHITAAFAPPPGTSGAPYSGPFSVAMVALGDRADGTFNGTTLDPTRTLDCTAEESTDSGGHTIYPTGCINDVTSTALTVSTRELTLAGPSSPTRAQAGKRVTIPFTLGYAGAHAAFALSGTSDARGAKLTPQDSKLSLTATSAATTTPEKLTVALPGTVAAGKHHVSLHVQASGAACTDPSICTRSATATIIVTGLRPTIGAVKLAKPKLALAFKLNVASKLKLTLEGKRRHHWSKLHSITRSAGQGTDHLRLRQLFAKQLANQGHFRVTLEASNHTLASKPRTVTFATS